MRAVRGRPRVGALSLHALLVVLVVVVAAARVRAFAQRHVGLVLRLRGVSGRLQGPGAAPAVQGRIPRQVRGGAPPPAWMGLAGWDGRNGWEGRNEGCRHRGRMTGEMPDATGLRILLGRPATTWDCRKWGSRVEAGESETPVGAVAFPKFPFHCIPRGMRPPASVCLFNSIIQPPAFSCGPRASIATETFDPIVLGTRRLVPSTSCCN